MGRDGYIWVRSGIDLKSKNILGGGCAEAEKQEHLGRWVGCAEAGENSETCGV